MLTPGSHDIGLAGYYEEEEEGKNETHILPDNIRDDNYTFQPQTISYLFLFFLL